MHLLDDVVLGLLYLILSLLLRGLALRVLEIRLQSPALHVRPVGAIFSFFHLTFGIDLGVENLLDLLVLLACLEAFIDVVEASLFVLLDALSDVFTFLTLLKFFIFVVNNVSHLVH